MQDKIIKVNKTRYLLRKILEEDSWQLYCKASDKVKDITRLIIRRDLSVMKMAL